MGGFSYVQGSGDDHELWGQVRDHLMTKMRAIDNSTNRELPTVPTASQGLTLLLFWKHRADLLGCSREELDAVVLKLVAAVREKEQAAPAPGRDGLEDGGWSTPPMPVLELVVACCSAPRQTCQDNKSQLAYPAQASQTVTGKRRSLSCTRRRTPRTQPIPMTKPRQKSHAPTMVSQEQTEKDGETVIIVVHGISATDRRMPHAQCIVNCVQEHLAAKYGRDGNSKP